MNIAETQELLVRLRLDSSALTSGLARLNGSLAGLSTRFGTAGAQFQRGLGQLASSIPRLATAGFLALGAATIYATKQASDFEDAFAGVARTLSDNKPELDAVGGLGKIREGLLAISRVLPITQTGLAGIAEIAGTAGVAAKDIVGFTEAIARLSKISDLNIEQITPAVSKLLLVLKVGSDELNNFFSGLEQASIIGPSTDQEIILATERFASLGQQIGFTRDQLLALATISTSFGQRPEAAGTSVLLVMQRLTRTLNEGGKKLELLAQISGKSADEIRAEWANNPYQGLIDFLTGLQKLSPGQQATVLKGLGLSTARIGQLLANLAANIPTLQKYTTEITKADQEGTLFLELSDKRFTTTKNHLIVLMNNVRDLGIAFGEGLGIDKATGALDRFITRLIDLLQKHRGDVVKFGEDFGHFLDNLDLDALARSFGVLVDAAKSFIGVLKNVPSEWLVIFAGIAGLNKLSGGLIAPALGNIFAGFTRGLGGIVANALGVVLKDIPILGKAFVQPVFVTNPGFGGIGGGVTIAGVSVAAIAAGIGAVILTQLPKFSDVHDQTAGNRETPAQRQARGFSYGGPLQDLILTLLGRDSSHLAPPIATNGPFGSDLAARNANHYMELIADYGRTEADLARQIADNTGGTEQGIAAMTRKLIDALKPEHRRGEVGKSIQTTEGRQLLKLSVTSPDFDTLLADLVKHYTEQPIGTKGHSRAFVLGNLNPIENRLGRQLKQALKAGDGGRADDIVQSLKALDKVPKNDLPDWIRKLIREAEKGHTKTEKAIKDEQRKLAGGIETTNERIAFLRRTLQAKHLSIRVGGPRVSLRPSAVNVTPRISVTIGARTVTRAIRSTIAYGPAIIYQQPGQIYEGPN